MKISRKNPSPAKPPPNAQTINEEFFDFINFFAEEMIMPLSLFFLYSFTESYHIGSDFILFFIISIDNWP